MLISYKNSVDKVENPFYKSLALQNYFHCQHFPKQFTCNSFIWKDFTCIYRLWNFKKTQKVTVNDLNIHFVLFIRIRTHVEENLLQFLLVLLCIYLPNSFTMAWIYYKVNLSVEYSWFKFQCFPSPKLVALSKFKNSVYSTVGFLPFSISKWNTNSFLQDLNLGCQFH